ncbi:S-type anion channel SLAH4-like, partial [Lotus japonicus]|uniref:S-type anion channel SLAH4-like n=1 Tax=Lotus japonicus TaxID=34305 RepID=UPI00258495FC
SHYLVLFVTLYQRLPGYDNSLPPLLRPVFFLFFAGPSVASLAWRSICGEFDTASKMLFFFLFPSSFLFMPLVSRPLLFKKSMKKFNVAWWAYSFPLTALALASAEYAHQVKGMITAHAVMLVLSLVLSLISVVVSVVLMIVTALNTSMSLPANNFDSN